MYALIGVTVVLLFIFLFVQRNIQNVPQMTWEELVQQQKTQQFQYIDVRTPEEFEKKHVLHFQNIPQSQLMSQVNQLDKNLPIIIMCTSGMRSAQAVRIFIKHEFHAFNLQGGIQSIPIENIIIKKI
ncbi:MAG: rhodanese-like domain-containing protein [Culicoidibacterales bacterium]